MRVKFLNFIEKHNLVHFGDRVLLAVSGGIDSMVMLNLFHGSGLGFPWHTAILRFAAMNPMATRSL